MTYDQRAGRLSALIAASLILASLALVLILPSDVLFCAPATDMTQEFVSSRAFLADSFRHGYLPLWNPYTYSGQPFVGGFESAALYPLNLLFLFLPLARAINFSILLHLVILGWGVERWASRRGLDRWAARLIGFFVAPLTGGVFPHIYAGHLSNLCTMAWAPWIFFGLETCIWDKNHRGLFLASFAICFQILAGHVQYFFYTSVAAGIYAVLLTIAEPDARRRALPGVGLSYLIGIALGAGQLLPGLAAAGECIRQQKLDRSFVAIFGFPPENFLTLIAPGIFGNISVPFYIGPEIPVYWGRCYSWEMILFIGSVGLLLIVVALLSSGKKRRTVILDLLTAGFLMVLALGIHTPLFDPLYQFVPGFGQFRGWSKFTFQATLFLVLAMATGADILFRRETKIPGAAGWIGLLTGAIAGSAGLVLYFNPQIITAILNFMTMTGESYMSLNVSNRPDMTHEAGIRAGLSLGIAGLILIAASLILMFQEKRPILRWAIPVMLLGEMISFAGGQLALSHLSDAMPDAIRQVVASHPGDYRVLDVPRRNNGFLLGASDLGGDNPAVLRRYAEFISLTQGTDPDHVTQALVFQNPVPIYSMLRLRYAFFQTAARGLVIWESSVAPLPRLLLVSDNKVVSGGRDAIFDAMANFDPGKLVLLEQEPEPRPEPGANGTVKLISDRPDEAIIEADTDRSTLMLMTDLYAKDWHAEALPDSSQKSYDLMPADYILRAVPLAAGHHHLRIVYAPPAVPIGIGISVTAWAIWFGLLVWTFRGKARGKSQGGMQNEKARHSISKVATRPRAQ